MENQQGVYIYILTDVSTYFSNHYVPKPSAEYLHFIQIYDWLVFECFHGIEDGSGNTKVLSSCNEECKF